MGFTGTLLGGMIGWAIGGPLGGHVGSVIGHHASRAAGPQLTVRRSQNDGASAAISLVVLMAAVTKVDEKVTKGEVSFVKEFLVRSFGRDNAGDLMQVYRNAIEKDLDLGAICGQISMSLDMASRIQIVHALIGLVQSDSHAHPEEIEIVRRIGKMLGIPADQMKSIEAMYWHDTAHAYQVLGVSEADSMDVIKSRYRELVKQYHPDKVANLGDEFREMAKQKFVQVQEAYEAIEKARAN